MVMVVWNARNTGESGLHDARREAGADRLRGLHEVVGM